MWKSTEHVTGQMQVISYPGNTCCDWNSMGSVCTFMLIYADVCRTIILYWTFQVEKTPFIVVIKILQQQDNIMKLNNHGKICSSAAGKRSLINPSPVEKMNLTYPPVTVKQSDYQMQILIQIHKLNRKQCRFWSDGSLKKPSDLDLIFLRQNKSWFN